MVFLPPLTGECFGFHLVGATWQKNPMDRGAWQATQSIRLHRVRHNWSDLPQNSVQYRTITHKPINMNTLLNHCFFSLCLYLFCLIQTDLLIIPEIFIELLSYQHTFSFGNYLYRATKITQLSVAYCLKDPVSNSKITISQIRSY